MCCHLRRPWIKSHRDSQNRCMHAQSLSRAQLFCDLMDYRPGSAVHGVSQARILEWVAISYSGGSSWFRDWTRVLCTADGFFTIEPAGKPHLGQTADKTLEEMHKSQGCGWHWRHLWKMIKIFKSGDGASWVK